MTFHLDLSKTNLLDWLVTCKGEISKRLVAGNEQTTKSVIFNIVTQTPLCLQITPIKPNTILYIGLFQMFTDE